MTTDLTVEQRLSRSIRNEALTGSAGDDAPPDGMSSVARRVAGYAQSQAAIKNQPTSSTAPTATTPNLNALLPTVPLLLADGKIRGSISPGSGSLSYDDQTQRYNLDIGFGYYHPQIGSESARGKLGFGRMLSPCLAAGGSTMLYYNDKRDLQLNTVMLLCGGMRLKVSGGYQWGDQNFIFPSGQSAVSLEQFSYALSASWIAPNHEGESGWLHTIGATIWGAKADQTSASTPAYYTTETATDYLVWRDPRQLSGGRLYGIAGDMQAALWSNLVLKSSLGYEQLQFPFADGSRERNQSLYTNMAITWEPEQMVQVGADWRGGASRNRYGISVSSGHLKLEGWYLKGRSGLNDDRGMSLSYTLLLPFGGGRQPLADRMRPSRSSKPAEMVTDAMTRPSQMPTQFLAKVDQTAVQQVASVSKTKLPAGVTVDSQGDIYMTVGTGAPTLTGFTRGGIAYDYAGVIETSGTQVVLHSLKMPDGAANWVISIIDGVGIPYDITFVTE